MDKIFDICLSYIYFLVCGQAFVRRIVGGKEALDCEYPWMVVVKAGNAFCAGTIIDDNTVITAAHCVFDQ